MVFTCRTCAEEPGSHSLRELMVDQDGTVVFYTCPAEASKYNDQKGIMEHYEGTLSDRVGDGTPWIWAFDPKGFSLKHLVEVGIATGIASLINDKFSKNLRHVMILNPSWVVNIVLTIVRPFISEELRNKIKICRNGRAAYPVSAGARDAPP